MKEMAQVIDKKNGQSLVRIVRSSACNKCDEKCMLGADQSHEVDEMDVLVNDPIDAEVGSMVELEMGAKPVLFSAFLVYLFPLVAIIAGYFAGSYLLAVFALADEIAGIIGSVVGFLLSFAFLKYFDKKAGAKSYFHPEIIRVVNNAEVFCEN